MKNIILALMAMLLPIFTLFAQQAGVSGKINDAGNNAALPLSSVSAIKSKTATTCDSKGTFTLRITIFPDTLVVSRTGYQQQKVVVKKPMESFVIVLQPEFAQLEDVTINTGYQKLKPNETNGSFVVVDNKSLNEQVGTNILQRLSGVTSSLLFNTGKTNPNPQNTTNISIRGLSTINGPLDPLIVVDNFIYEGNINNINPNDVENVTVLKDAAAASIWGARAGNGVIVITTKKARFNQKMQVDFNSDVIVSSKPDLYYLPQIASSDYIDVEQFLFGKGYYDSRITSTSRPALTPAVEVMLAKRNGLISAADSAQQINALKKLDSRDQYTKYFYRDAVTQQYSINLRGGSQNMSWLVSGTYDRNANSLRSTYNKANIRIENTFRPIKNLTINVGVYYTASKSVSGMPAYGNADAINGSTSVPYLQFADANGNAIATTNIYRNSYTDTAGGGKLLNWKYYPLDDWKHNVATNSLNEMLANIGLRYQLLKGLSLDLKYQYQKQRSVTENLADTQSFSARNMINLFSQINYQTGVVSYIVPLGSILTRNSAELFSQNFRGQLSYDREWNGMHKLLVLAGMETRETGNTVGADTYYGYNADPLHYTNVDLVNYYPTFITGSTSQISGSNAMSRTNYRFASFFSNAAYVYKGRYILSGSLREDGSNLFGANTNDKWKPLWSAGLGWELSREGFYKTKWLPYLKLSATMGYSGNVDVTKTALPVATVGTDRTTGLPFIRVNSLNNPDLKWEQAYQSNLRLEFSSAKNAVSGSIEYYHKKGTDLYGLTPYDYTAWGGSSTITKNVASMSGNGVDITLQTKNIDKAFKWNTALLFSYNTSKTTQYYSALANPIAGMVGGGTSINPVVGEPLYSIVAFKWGGLDANGNPQGISGQNKKYRLYIDQHQYLR